MKAANQRNSEMGRGIVPQCARCKNKECRDGEDCFQQAPEHKSLYDDDVATLHHAASAIEGRFYGQETRLGEIILLAKELGYQRLGLAFCIGLSEEAQTIESVLSKHFQVASVCCKVCGIDKKEFGLQQISSQDDEVMCNPAGQAQLLNEAQTQFNIICGLCVGHDSIFARFSNAPVTTLIAKDRVLAHNPAAAVYCQYIRKHFNKNRNGDTCL
jgi:uncharacterized metal-binding protein